MLFSSLRKEEIFTVILIRLNFNKIIKKFELKTDEENYFCILIHYSDNSSAGF